ncbi:hypothetical protein ABH995_000776 [Bradyrhizobium yuanmingense]|uniref:hypothetical protein n=1 Tax=Bradyrhizobium yuanmingense TaxID=108015 RepID=UPI003515AE3B
MRVILKGVVLTPQGAQSLRQQIAGDRSNASVDALLDHLIELGANYAIVESPYTDRDYTSDYLSFYAGAFKAHARGTKRIHFFRTDISKLFELPLSKQVIELERLAAKDKNYCGFVVIRPIAQGPIGRTVLRFPSIGKLTVRPAARADFESHVLGVRVKVTGAPFIQQDMRLGACAQAAIWMAGRAVETRHRRTSSYTIAEITNLAINPTDSELSRSLPAGSEGLNPMHMIRALRGMGHQPLHMLFKELDSGQQVAATINAPEVIHRYLDSGLPVVIAMADMGHAICAVGYVEVPGKAVRDGGTHAVFARGLIVHDDQRGPYRVLPLSVDDIEHLPSARLMKWQQNILTVEENVSHMFVPLPSRVFLRAENADIVVRDFIKTTSYVSDQIVKAVGNGNSTAAANIRAFFDGFAAGRWIQRTYLTTAARYRRHISASEMNEPMKSEIVSRALPHFIWVTELIDRSSKQERRTGARPVVGHFVLNATSSTDYNNDLLIAQFPHFIVHRDVNPIADNGDIQEVPAESMVSFDTNIEYLGRTRTVA